MAYSRETVPKNHSEFGGGPGPIDPEVRKDRVGLTNEERLMEVYATTTYGPEYAHGATPEEREARAAEIEVQNDPETATLERP